MQIQWIVFAGATSGKLPPDKTNLHNYLTLIQWLLFVGATIGRPPELCLNHKFDICFWYEKSLINR